MITIKWTRFYFLSYITIFFSLFPFFVHSKINLTGVGATFPELLYFTWAVDYEAATGIRVNYQGIGSSGGVKQVIAQTVDFGATDIPLSTEELKKYQLIQFPVVLGGIVPVINVPGIKINELILDGETLANIYLGKIKKWNDETIKKLNPQLTLPDMDIVLIRRAEGSGTTAIFAQYLAESNSQWKKQVGVGKVINWPGNSIGGKGNSGVAAFVKRFPGSIGYVEYSYAKRTRLVYTRLVAMNGNAVTAESAHFSLGKGKKLADLERSLVNQSGENLWPIIGATYILLNVNPKNHDHQKAVINFFEWSFINGAEKATQLDYVPLSKNIIKEINQYFDIIK